MKLLNFYMEKNKMRTIQLQAERMCQEKTAHEYLQEMLELPEYYGKNLDALYDCLTSLSDVEFRIAEFEVEGQIQENLDAAYWRKVKKVFLQAEKVNKKITVLFL